MLLISFGWPHKFVELKLAINFDDCNVVASVIEIRMNIEGINKMLMKIKEYLIYTLF